MARVCAHSARARGKYDPKTGWLVFPACARNTGTLPNHATRRPGMTHGARRAHGCWDWLARMDGELLMMGDGQGSARPGFESYKPRAKSRKRALSLHKWAEVVNGARKPGTRTRARSEKPRLGSRQPRKLILLNRRIALLGIPIRRARIGPTLFDASRATRFTPAHPQMTQVTQSCFFHAKTQRRQRQTPFQLFAPARFHARRATGSRLTSISAVTSSLGW